MLLLMLIFTHRLPMITNTLNYKFVRTESGQSHLFPSDDRRWTPRSSDGHICGNSWTWLATHGGGSIGSSYPGPKKYLFGTSHLNSNWQETFIMLLSHTHSSKWHAKIVALLKLISQRNSRGIVTHFKRIWSTNIWQEFKAGFNSVIIEDLSFLGLIN